MPDGRLLRTISVRGDSAGIFRGLFRVPVDSDWVTSKRYEQQRGKDSITSSVYVYEARKEFPDFNALNSFFYNDSTFTDHISIMADLSKKSRWFYTFYTYNETYSMLFPFRSVPIRDYLSDTELSIYQAGDNEIGYSPSGDSLMIVTDSVRRPVLSDADSARFKQLRDSLEHKFEAWQKINIYNELYRIVHKAFEKLGRSAGMANDTDAFFHWLDSARVFESVMENSDAFVQEAAAFYHLDPRELKAADQEGFDMFARKFRVSAFTLETYTNRVLMPGMIVSANTHDKNGNLVAWHFKAGKFYASDFTMKVVSRTVNKSAVVLAALLLVVITGLILLRLSSRRPDRSAGG
jgi:hypothetical protein